MSCVRKMPMSESTAQTMKRLFLLPSASFTSPCSCWSLHTAAFHKGNKTPQIRNRFVKCQKHSRYCLTGVQEWSDPTLLGDQHSWWSHLICCLEARKVSVTGYGWYLKLTVHTTKRFLKDTGWLGSDILSYNSNDLNTNNTVQSPLVDSVWTSDYIVSKCTVNNSRVGREIVLLIHTLFKPAFFCRYPRMYAAISCSAITGGSVEY